MKKIECVIMDWAGTSWILHYNVIFQSNLILDNLYRVQDLPIQN